jgi:hypothetical protein
MKLVFRTLTLLAFAAVLPAQQPWQKIVDTTAAEAAANLRTPPREYGAIHWAIWGDELSRERIVREFDQLAANGIYVVNLGPSRGMTPKYFSPEHLALVKFAVEEARKRGMKVWLADEGSYPSGFGGGRISEEYPQLTMQGIVADTRVSVAPGQTVSFAVLPDTLGALAIVQPRSFPGAQAQAGAAAAAATGNATVLPIRGGQIKWTAPPDGRSEVVLVRHVYRSSPTRYINRADGTYSKDSLYALIDYLDPDATRAYLKTTHEVYKEMFGQEFGKTVLGFFGDEPDYTGFIPWTPKLLDTFRELKGYDLQPYIPLFFAPKLTDEAKRAKADYWDVWSGIFRDSFYGVQAEWCAKNNLEYLVHLNHEELMLNLSRPEDLIRNEGDFFRDMRHVHVPGIDNLGQLVPRAVIREDTTYDSNDNFPKLASSAAHLFGRPRVWTESGGGTGVDGKFQLDYQYVRGVNAPQIRVPAVREGAAAAEPAPPQAAMMAWYTNRTSYLMAIGRPAAQVALYHPANSMWLGDEAADRSTTKLGKQLLEHQIDFDYFDEQSLAGVATLEGGGFKNLSGQVYRAVIVPSSTVISKVGLDRLKAMAAAGGKVIFVGAAPSLVVDKAFLGATQKPDLGFATLLEPSGDITASVIAALPKPDVALDSPCPAIKYTHRAWRDADLYYFFNESATAQSRTAEVAGHGQPQVWDAATAEIHPMTGVAAGKDSLRLQLTLQPYEAKIVVIGPAPKTAAAPEPPQAAGEVIIEFPVAKPDAPFKGQVTLAVKPAGKRIYVECADIHDYASLQVNGKDAGARAWQPYRWDVTDLLNAGVNTIEIQVRTLPAGGRGGMGAPPPPAAGAAPAGAPPIGGRGPVAGAPPASGRGNATPPPAPGLFGAVRLVAR